MKPIIILPPDTMSAEDIERLRANELCVVVSADPSKVKFVDPIPAASQRTKIEDAAIKLSRKILNPGFWTSDVTRDNMARVYMEILVQGTPLDPQPPKAEQEAQLFDQAKREEIIRLAREEAKSERAAQKATAKK